MSNTPAIHPSILNADQAHLAEELARIESADGLHLDVMDNHFVPNMFAGPSFTQTVLEHTSLPVDAHLMIEDADRWAPQYAEMGCAVVTAHAEATRAPEGWFGRVKGLHRRGAQAGIALRPTTPLEVVEPLLGEIDMLLIMTVEPGFGGQSFVEPMLRKIAAARSMVSAQGLQLRIQIDGGVSLTTIERAAEDVFVAGSAVYKSQDAAQAISTLRRLAGAVSGEGRSTTGIA